MLRWVSVGFLIPGIAAGAFGFTGVAGTATWIVQLLFFLFAIAFITTLFWSR